MKPSIIVLCLSLAPFLFAADEKSAPKPPVISPEHKAAYFQADGAVAHLQPGWAEANIVLQKTVTDIRTDCGPGWIVNPVGVDAAHPVGTDLVCVKAPEASPAPAVPTAPASK